MADFIVSLDNRFMAAAVTKAMPIFGRISFVKSFMSPMGTPVFDYFWFSQSWATLQVSATMTTSFTPCEHG
jgi:hypothetical protein